MKVVGGPDLQHWVVFPLHRAADRCQSAPEPNSGHGGIEIVHKLNEVKVSSPCAHISVRRDDGAWRMLLTRS
jgi:hypothetical protein